MSQRIERISRVRNFRMFREDHFVHVIERLRSMSHSRRKAGGR